jgi:hypothetical protein
VGMDLEYKEKTIFTTPWGAFMYDTIPFCLINAREKFQRDMEITFLGDKDRFIVIYLDAMNLFSRKYENDINNFR